MFEVDADHLDEMWRVARRAAGNKLSPSAYGNLAEDVASQAIFEYWKLVERGEEVANPQAMVTTIAQRRAIDAQRKWELRKHPTLEEINADDDRVVIAPELVRRALQDLPPTATIVGWLEQAVIESGGNEVDAQLARLVWLDAISPDVAAAQVGLAEKTARNRLTRARRRLEKMVEGEARSW